jgi:hypothetical protein
VRTGIRIAMRGKRPAPAGLIEAMNSLKDALDEAIPRALNNKRKPM